MKQKVMRDEHSPGMDTQGPRRKHPAITNCTTAKGKKLKFYEEAPCKEDMSIARGRLALRRTMKLSIGIHPTKKDLYFQGFI